MDDKQSEIGKINRRGFVKSAAIGVTAVGMAKLGMGGAATAQSVETWTPDIIIEGMNNPVRDAPEVQAAVSAYNRILLKGRFNFGDGTTYPRQTVTISKGVQIRGETTKDASGKNVSWLTEITGGGAKLPSFLWGDVDSGPFKVMNQGPLNGGDNKGVIFQGISFAGWKGEAISAEACHGLEVRGCQFTQPEPGGSDVFPFLVVHAIFPVGPLCTGNFVAEDNVCFYRDYETWPDDEQLLACLLSSFSSISIARNDITGHDEGVEVIFNGLYSQDPTFQSTVSIKDNKITLTQVVGEKWSGHVGVVCMKNPKSLTEISGNEINASGPGTGFVVSGDGITIRNNTCNQTPLDANDSNTYPIASLMLGYYAIPPSFPTDLGASCNDSVISNNTLSGTAAFGFLTYDANPNPYEPIFPLNTSHDNVVRGNNTDNLVSLVATVFLSLGTHDNVFKGGFGSVIDMGTNNIVTGFTLTRGEITANVSEAMRRFGEGIAAKIAPLLGAMQRQ